MSTTGLTSSSLPAGPIETTAGFSQFAKTSSRLDSPGNLYCMPRFKRGTGLGNRLFVWARCRLFSHLHQARMIAPLWFRPAIGPLVRGGIDYRNYLRQIALLGLFHKRADDLGWLVGQIRTLRMRAISETEWTNEAHDRQSFTEPLLVNFDSPRYTFADLNGWNEILHSELRAITRSRLLRFDDHQPAPPIGVNIRCGNDFKVAPEGGDYTRVGWLQKTPLQWFIDTLRIIRERAGWPVPAVVVSDGKPAALSALMDLGNVSFLRPGNAITDLLVLARSGVLLASGSSTFSAWATFLGQMPAATAPGHPMSNWQIEGVHGQFIGEFDPRAPGTEFLSQVQRLF